MGVAERTGSALERKNGSPESRAGDSDGIFLSARLFESAGFGSQGDSASEFALGNAPCSSLAPGGRHIHRLSSCVPPSAPGQPPGSLRKLAILIPLHLWYLCWSDGWSTLSSGNHTLFSKPCVNFLLPLNPTLLYVILGVRSTCLQLFISCQS